MITKLTSNLEGNQNIAMAQIEWPGGRGLFILEPGVTLTDAYLQVNWQAGGSLPASSSLLPHIDAAGSYEFWAPKGVISGGVTVEIGGSFTYVHAWIVSESGSEL